MDITSFRVLPRNTAEGKRYVVDTNRNGSADPGEQSLVRVTDDGWQHVDQLDGPVHRDTMGKDIGFWSDQQISHTEGFWPWKRTTVIDRPFDGKIDADEVGQISWERTSDSSYSLGSEISQDKDGRFFLSRHDAHYGLRIIGQAEINSQRAYINDDANWIVKG